MISPQKRVFLALGVEAAWPKEPPGRPVPQASRHVTLKFIGAMNEKDEMSLIESLSHLPRSLGFAGMVEKVFFLPERDPRVAAYHVMVGNKPRLNRFKEGLLGTLNLTDTSPWLSHTTAARAPFSKHDWEAFFSPFPCVMSTLHLYQSFPDLDYRPLATYHLHPPFEEIPHEADFAYLIRGETIEELYFHALYALAFQYPVLLKIEKEAPPYLNRWFPP